MSENYNNQNNNQNSDQTADAVWSESVCCKTEGTAPENKGKRSVGIGTCVVITLAACLLTFMVTFIAVTVNSNMRFVNYATTLANNFGSAVGAKISSIDSVIRSEFLYDVDDTVLSDSVLKGYMAGLGDRYAEYYTAEEFAEMMSDTNGEMQGIGISIVNDADTKSLQIIAVFPDSPALEAGLLPGDRIAYVKVDGEYKSVAELGYQASVTAMQGKAGTLAEFIAYREGDFDDGTEYSIKRGFVTEVTVEGRLYGPDNTVGIIRITSFDKKTPEQFCAALDSLVDAGATALILDVRFNPGGELTSVCTVLDTLLPQGPVIRTVDKDGNEEIVYTSDKNEVDMPMVVIANGNTASAGELFTAALKDYNKAVFVGTQTFGKGSMQTIRSFSDGSGFKFTYRYYCPPYSDNYDGVGISPDIEAELSEEASQKSFYTLSDEEDDQLTAAYEALKNQVN